MKKTWFFVPLVTLMMSVGLLAAQESGSAAKVYELKHRSAAQMGEFLDGMLRSAGGRLFVSTDFNTLQVVGNPAVHEMTMDLLKRYDTPPPEFELRFYLLRAEQGGRSALQDLPSEIAAIAREVSELTRYDSFEVIDTPILRLTAGRDASISGEASVAYGLAIRRSTVSEGEDKALLRVQDFEASFSVVGYTQEEQEPLTRRASISTSFSIADDEKLVLGTSQLAEADNDEPFAIVTIVHARRLRQ